MSYDIELLRLSGPGDPLTQAHRARDAVHRRYEQVETSSPEEEADRAKLAADLVALHPSLFAAPFDKGSSHGCVVTTDEPGLQHSRYHDRFRRRPRDLSIFG